MEANYDNNALPRCVYKFTGKERDTESGLDNFGARYDASSLGRFMTPDWAARPTTIPYAVFGDPQSLNLYSYVRNDPVSRADGDGHDGVVALQGECYYGSCLWLPPACLVDVEPDASTHLCRGAKSEPGSAYKS
jgi:RHS repeat-associated protein